MMGTPVINATYRAAYSFITKSFGQEEGQTLIDELNQIVGETGSFSDQISFISGFSLEDYEKIQEELATINEKESVRKDKGVYYTPKDVVQFIIHNVIKSVYHLIQSDRLQDFSIADIPVDDFCFKKSVLEPTCGAGEFLLAALEKKFDVFLSAGRELTCADAISMLKTLSGNDINPESVIITKVRLYLLVIEKCRDANLHGVAKVLNDIFTSVDFVTLPESYTRKFDLIVGNPPYVEDSKYGELNDKFGNIYCNILSNSGKLLNKGGAIGFIIPISYSTTPRMRKIREDLSRTIPVQYILTYADRPDCLFSSVHQKLCILIGHDGNENAIYTSKYNYWYKEERGYLFQNLSLVKNPFYEEQFIPKLGNDIDVSIYSKIVHSSISIAELTKKNGVPMFLNMRACFWIKAFLVPQKSAEYKPLFFESENMARFIYCLVNSTLFWWYWVCVSDCWHITQKELQGFKIPNITSFEKSNELARALEDKLEITKKYIGSKQTDYEYKHKDCLDEIFAIDNYIGQLYGLSESESDYLKHFALKYRTSAGPSTSSFHPTTMVEETMPTKYRVIDLFAGCGGLSLGFMKDGYQVETAVEYDSSIATTYKNNHPEVNVIIDDIRNVDNSSVFAEHSADIIIGGPPCQGFSMAGARIRNGFIDDPRNYLFKSYFNIVKAVKPKAFVFENVKGILTMNEGKIFEEILNVFSNADLLDGQPYYLYYKVVKGTDFGIPQKRERVILIGSKTPNLDIASLWDATKAEIQSRYPHYFDDVTVYDAIGNMPSPSDDGVVKNPKTASNYQKYLMSNGCTIANHNRTNHSSIAVSRMSRVKSGENFTVLDEEINSVHSGSYGRLAWDQPSATITTRFDTPSGGRFTHPVENRTLTPREAARIQSFPDDFVFYGKRTSICRQIGNAVPPKISYFLARLIRNILNEEGDK